MKKRQKFSRVPLIIHAGWLAGGVLLAFFTSLLTDSLWILVSFLWFGYAALGVILIISTAVWAWKHRKVRGAFLTFATYLLLTIGLFFIAPYLASTGDNFVFNARFNRDRATYEKTIAQVKNQSSPSQTDSPKTAYEVDPGPPIRIAFPQPGGILDNWEAVIYDPTGKVLQAQGLEATPPEISALFGGTLVQCEPIQESYYRCWFT